jgi:hypothetical protein
MEETGPGLYTMAGFYINSMHFSGSVTRDFANEVVKISYNCQYYLYCINYRLCISYSFGSCGTLGEEILSP